MKEASKPGRQNLVKHTGPESKRRQKCVHLWGRKRTHSLSHSESGSDPSRMAPGGQASTMKGKFQNNEVSDNS